MFISQESALFNRRLSTFVWIWGKKSTIFEMIVIEVCHIRRHRNDSETISHHMVVNIDSQNTVQMLDMVNPAAIVY